MCCAPQDAEAEAAGAGVVVTCVATNDDVPPRPSAASSSISPKETAMAQKCRLFSMGNEYGQIKEVPATRHLLKTASATSTPPQNSTQLAT